MHAAWAKHERILCQSATWVHRDDPRRSPNRSIRLPCMKLRDDRYHFDEVASTNDSARRLAEQGAPGGTLVTADNQSAGRGRHGRRWISNPGQSLLMSVILRPRCSNEELGMVTVISALAAAETIDELAAVRTSIKWPNDIQIGDRKVGGILLESTRAGNAARPEYVIVGMGINVTQTDFPPDLEEKATSLLLESGTLVSRDELADRIKERLSTYLDEFERGDGEAIRRDYQTRLAGLGEDVVLHAALDGAATVTGRLSGIDPFGAAIVETPGGDLVTCHSGEVTTSPS